MKRYVCLAFMAALMAGAAVSEAATALITELKKGTGTIEIRRAGRDLWQPALPLQGLEAGDSLRATGDGYATVVYASGGKKVRVAAANSPLKIVEPRQQDAQAAKAQQVFRDITGFLAGKKTEQLSAPMAVRRLNRPLAIISPKNTRVLPGSRPVFEWMGPSRVYYRLRLVSSGTEVWSSGQVVRTRLAYPEDAPALRPGGSYSWEVETADAAPVRAEFTVAGLEEKDALGRELSMIEPEQGNAVSATAAVLRYGILARKGFYAEARNVLLSAAAADPDEPSLHILLAEYYRHVGLKDMAAEEEDEADFLLRKRP
ncbi:MAG: hypothetical protein OHK006_22980 [Thermodesulfovibrionales bacterium]